MKIREVKLEDAPMVSEVARMSVEPFKNVDFDDKGWKIFLKSTSLPSTQKRIRNNSYFCACYIQSDLIVGFITIKDFEKIDQLFVAPGAQKSGVARELWMFARNKCMESSTSGKFWVRSSSHAIPVYMHFGFKKIGILQKENGIVYQLMQLVENKSQQA